MSRKQLTLEERLQQELQDDIKKQKEILTETILDYKPTDLKEDQSFVSKFIDVASNQATYIYKLAIRQNYYSKYNYSYKYKKQILEYIFLKNNLQSKQIAHQMRRDITEQQKDKYFKQMNRVNVIFKFAECQNRLGINSLAWGFAASSTVMLLPFGLWRRLALGITIVYMSGSLSYHRNIDRIFDKVYPFFQQDLAEYKKWRLHNKDEGEVNGDIIDKQLQLMRVDSFLKEI